MPTRRWGRKPTANCCTRWPQLSAAPRRWRLPVWLAALAITILAAFCVFPGETRTAIEAGAAFAFLAWLMLRLIGSFLAPPLVRPARISERGLPVYTIIVALYREAAAVEGLVAALRALDYPPEKLDIKLVIEADDLETGIALLRLNLGAPFEIIIAPADGPRTKPKALNAALPFARGSFTVVYDAEDRPEPDQLRARARRVPSADDDLACVQARLTIDNTDDSWLARLFTAEYAAQFDLFLPGLAALATAAAARRLVQSFPHRRAAQGRRLGPLQRHRGCRPRHAARALRLSLDHRAVDHLRGSAGPLWRLAAPAHALVQGLDANLARAHAIARTAVRATSGSWDLCRSSLRSAAACWPRSFIP